MCVSSSVSKYLTLFSILLLIGMASPQAHAVQLLVDQNDAGCDDTAGTPYCTIQSAIDTATSEDTIFISSGTYTENLVVDGKSLTLTGSGTDQTVLDGNAAGNVVRAINSTSEMDFNFSALTIQNGSGTLGGGILVDAGNVTLNDVDLHHNEAAFAGGGLSVGSGSLMIVDSTLEENTAGTDGGGVSANFGAVNLLRTHVLKNTAKNGGGVNTNTADLKVEDTEFAENKAEVAGGGLRTVNGTVLISSSKLNKNTSDADYGAAFFDGSGVEIKDSEFLENAATETVGGFAVNNANLVIARTKINANVAASIGGFSLKTGDLSLIDAEVIGNQATELLYGGLDQQDGDATLTRVKINKNTAKLAYNGAYFSGEGTTTVLDSEIDGNYGSTTNGGGLARQDGSLIVRRSKITNNLSDSYGAGMSAVSVKKLLIDSSLFSGNKTTFDGAGLLVSAEDGVIKNSTFSGNSAGVSGGALSNLSNLKIYNSTIVYNRAGNDEGLNGAGGGILNGTSLVVKNSIIALNEAENAPDCYSDLAVLFSGHDILGNSDSCTRRVMDTDLIGSKENPIDPLVAELADNGGPTQTHALLEASPALDGGNPSGCEDETGNALSVDQRGYTRPVGTACDIGAFEKGSCGDSTLDDGEQCDDGNSDNTDDCLNTCQNATCGDSFIQEGVETCDDGNQEDGDGCSATCTLEEDTTSSTNDGGDTQVGSTGEGTTDGTDGTDGTEDPVDGTTNEGDPSGSTSGANGGGGCALNGQVSFTSMTGIYLLMVGGFLGLVYRKRNQCQQ